MSQSLVDAAPARGEATAADLLTSAYDWESERETITLGDAVQYAPVFQGSPAWQL